MHVHTRVAEVQKKKEDGSYLTTPIKMMTENSSH